MGTETSQPDVEESTELPSSSSLHEGPTEPLPSPLNRSSAETAGDSHPVEGEKEKPVTATVSAHQAVPVPSTITAGEAGWDDQSQFAHTLAPADIARILDVDLQ